MLNTAQRTALLADINGNPTRANQLATGQDQALADYYNTGTAFDAWRDKVSITETGQVFNGTEWAGMSSLNHTRLQTIAQFFDTVGYDASKTDIRAMFNDIWSGAGGANTRVSLAALWKVKLTVLQKMFATDGDLDGVWNCDLSPGPAGRGYIIGWAEISTLRNGA